MTQSVAISVAVLIGAALGALIGWLLFRAGTSGLHARLEEREKEVTAVRGELAAVRDVLLKTGQDRDRMAGMIEAERAGFAEKVAFARQRQDATQGGLRAGVTGGTPAEQPSVPPSLPI